LQSVVDSTLFLKPQIAAISSACLFDPRRIRQLRSTIVRPCSKHWYSALSWHYYCNSVLYGLPESTLLPLNWNTPLGCKAVSWTLLSLPYHSWSWRNTLASYSWMYLLQTHVQSMHK